jgi:hypothetical protein
MSALSMTTAVTAKVAIAGKSVVSKRKRRRGAEQERAIGTRALIYFFTRIFGTL